MAEQTQALMTTSQKLARIAPKFEAIDAAAKELRSLVVSDTGSPSHAIQQAAAMQTLRELMDSEVMAPIMAIQGCALGFKTDKDTQGGYPEHVVRDCAIEAMGRGASLTRNRFNIISARCYLTKEYMADRLDAVQGRGRWMFVHGLPQVKRGTVTRKDKQTQKMVQFEGVIGATVETLVKWQDGAEWREEKLVHDIKGDEWASPDSYLGKADRKCGAWLLARVTGERVPDGDADESVTVEGTARSVADAPAAAAPGDTLKARKAAKAPAASTLEDAPADLKAAPAGAVEVKLVSVLAAIDSTKTPRGLAVRYLQSIGRLEADRGLDGLTDQGIMRAIHERPQDFAKKVSEWESEQQAAQEAADSDAGHGHGA